MSAISSNGIDIPIAAASPTSGIVNVRNPFLNIRYRITVSAIKPKNTPAKSGLFIVSV